MRGRKHGLNSGESLSGPAGSAANKARYKPSGESRTDARQEVGDGHSTVEGRESITRSEGRAISLEKPQTTGRVRANAESATPAPRNRTRVLWDRLYASAKSQPERRYGNLFDEMWRPDVLAEAWKRGAPGVDGKSIHWIREYGAERFLAELGEVLRAGDYHPELIPRKKAEKGMRRKLKDAAQRTRLGDPMDPLVKRYNAMLRGWTNYFRIGNVEAALTGLVRHACMQLRILLRRRYGRKRSPYSRRRPDRTFQPSILPTDC